MTLIIAMGVLNLVFINAIVYLGIRIRATRIRNEVLELELDESITAKQRLIAWLGSSERSRAELSRDLDYAHICIELVLNDNSKGAA